TKVYLPEGDWYYLYSDQRHTGKQAIYQDCPLNYLPVYVKAGEIFTQQHVVNHTGEQHDRILEIHVYKGGSGSEFVHYEDAGNGLEYLTGAHFKRRISYNPGEGTLTFGEVEGSYPSDFDQLKIYFHGFDCKTISVSETSQSIQKIDFSFLERLTEFDPLPESEHPYFEVKNLSYIELQHDVSSFTINGLK